MMLRAGSGKAESAPLLTPTHRQACPPEQSCRGEPGRFMPVEHGDGDVGGEVDEAEKLAEVGSVIFTSVGTMGQVLHGSATTTEASRRAIQSSQESLRTLGLCDSLEDDRPGRADVGRQVLRVPVTGYRGGNRSIAEATMLPGFGDGPSGGVLTA